MTGKQAIASALKSTGHMMSLYLGDLSDADLLVRPVPGANHIAWQLGHLIQAESYLVKQAVPNAVYPELPAGFAQAHSPEAAKVESTQGYLKKDEYMGLFQKVRAATMAALEKGTDADLDRATEGSMAKYAPTAGEMYLLVSNHTLMHAGQFTAVRRKLGKPVVM
jgi:hypothetical protein